MKRIKSFPIKPEDSHRVKIYAARRGISGQKFYITAINDFLAKDEKQQSQLLSTFENLYDGTHDNIRQTFVIDDAVHIALNTSSAFHKVSVGKMLRCIITSAIKNERDS